MTDMGAEIFDRLKAMRVTDTEALTALVFLVGHDPDALTACLDRIEEIRADMVKQGFVVKDFG